MQIILSDYGLKHQVLIDGEDITSKLQIRKIEILAESQSFAKAIITCIPDEIIAEILDSAVEINVSDNEEGEPLL